MSIAGFAPHTGVRGPGVIFPDSPPNPRGILGYNSLPNHLLPAMVQDPGSDNFLLILDSDGWKSMIDELKDGIPPGKDFATDFRRFAKHFGLTARAAIEVDNGRTYVVINAPRNDAVRALKSTKLIDRFRCADFVLGTVADAREAVKGMVFSIGVVIVADLAKAVIDKVMNDKDLLTIELGCTLAADVTKAIACGAITYAVGVGLAAALTASATITLPIVVGAGMVIVIGYAVGKAVDAILPTEKLAAVFCSAVGYVQGALDQGARALQAGADRAHQAAIAAESSTLWGINKYVTESWNFF